MVCWFWQCQQFLQFFQITYLAEIQYPLRLQDLIKIISPSCGMPHGGDSVNSRSKIMQLGTGSSSEAMQLSCVEMILSFCWYLKQLSNTFTYLKVYICYCLQQPDINLWYKKMMKQYLSSENLHHVIWPRIQVLSFLCSINYFLPPNEAIIHLLKLSVKEVRLT